MYHYSDSESSDSDKGIRYKTASTRHKSENCELKPDRSNIRRSRNCSTSPPARDSKIKHDRKLREERKCVSKRKRRDDNRDGDRKHSKSDRHKEKVVGSGKVSDKRKGDTTSERKRSPMSQKNNVSEVEDNNIIGPSKENELEASSSDDSDEIIGPVLPSYQSRRKTETSPTPKGDIIGPILPTHLKDECEKSPQLDEELESIGPNLQASSKEESDSIKPERRIIGPSLPPHLKQTITSLEAEDSPPTESTSNPTTVFKPAPSSTSGGGEGGEGHVDDDVVWTTIDSIGDDSDDNEVYGPLPVGATATRAHVELEERALQMQIDQLAPKGRDEPTREEWMTELPAAKAATFGMGPRQFRSKAGPDLSDRSSWTDTPQDKANKKKKKKDEIDYQKEAELAAILERDKEQELIAKKIKRTKESLVDIHTKKMKTKKDDGPTERRPFSRDVDLQVNRFDDAQKKAVLKKAQLLDTRFSTGESKFL